MTLSVLEHRDKLGVKPGLAIAVEGKLEAEFLREIGDLAAIDRRSGGITELAISFVECVRGECSVAGCTART